VHKGSANIKKDADGKMDGESFMQEFVRSMKEDQDCMVKANLHFLIVLILTKNLLEE
jgi:hypothetical protein